MKIMDDQILIKMENSPYYIVQLPLYDYNHPDTQAHIKSTSNFFTGDVDELPILEPKLVEPWKYRLAAQYNQEYNEENNINPLAHLFIDSYSSEDEEN